MCVGQVRRASSSLLRAASTASLCRLMVIADSSPLFAVPVRTQHGRLVLLVRTSRASEQPSSHAPPAAVSFARAWVIASRLTSLPLRLCSLGALDQSRAWTAALTPASPGWPQFPSERVEPGEVKVAGHGDPRARSGLAASETAAARSVAVTRSRVALETAIRRGLPRGPQESRVNASPLSFAGLLEGLAVAAGEERPLCDDEPVPGIEKQIDILPMRPRKLVDGPDREGRFPQLPSPASASARLLSFLSAAANAVRLCHELQQVRRRGGRSSSASRSTATGSHSYCRPEVGGARFSVVPRSA